MADQTVLCRQVKIELHSLSHLFVDLKRYVLCEVPLHFFAIQADLACIVCRNIVNMFEPLVTGSSEIDLTTIAPASSTSRKQSRSPVYLMPKFGKVEDLKCGVRSAECGIRRSRPTGSMPGRRSAKRRLKCRAFCPGQAGHLATQVQIREIRER